MAKVYKNGPSKCQKHFRKNCDMNMIMRKHNFNLSGLMSSPRFMTSDVPKYVDFKSQDDYQTNCNKVAAIKTAFEKLPANIKVVFQNDPGQYIEFMYNVSNPNKELNTREKAIELGLVPKIDSEQDIRARLVAEGVAKAELDMAVQAEMEKKYPAKSTT